MDVVTVEVGVRRSDLKMLNNSTYPRKVFVGIMSDTNC